MHNYHNLEDKIIIFLNESNYDEKNTELVDLVEIFNTYWKLYQDNWPNSYWEIYNSSDETGIQKDHLEKSNILSLSGFGNNNSLMKNDVNKCIEETGNILNTKETYFQTNILINLDDIDKDLEKVPEISEIKEKKEKRRNCLDCNIF